MGGKAARSAVDFLPDGADAYPAYNIAFAVIISRRRPDKAKPPSGNRCRRDNAGWRVRLSGLQNRSSSDTGFAFVCNMKARGCVPAEIGEPKRE